MQRNGGKKCEDTWYLPPEPSMEEKSKNPVILCVIHYRQNPLEKWNCFDKVHCRIVALNLIEIH
jgi:hypothetical protein